MRKLFVLFFVFALAVSSYARKNQKQVPHLYPFTPDMKKFYVDPTILRDRFELNLDIPSTKTVYSRKKRYESAMNGTLDLHILQEPILKPIQNTDMLYVHPKFLTTILFPDSLKITFARASFNPNVFEYSENMIMIQPGKKFDEGNIVVTLTDKNRNYMVNIVLQKFDANMVMYDNYFKRYASKDKTYLSIYYRYILPPKYSKVKLLQYYMKLSGLQKGKDMKRRFPKNGDSDSFVVQGIPFYITRDDKFGDVEFENLSFRITNSPIGVQ